VRYLLAHPAIVAQALAQHLYLTLAALAIALAIAIPLGLATAKCSAARAPIAPRRSTPRMARARQVGVALGLDEVFTGATQASLRSNARGHSASERRLIRATRRERSFGQRSQ